MAVLVPALLVAACGGGGGAGSTLTGESKAVVGRSAPPVVVVPVADTRTAFEVAKGATVLDFQNGTAQGPLLPSMSASAAISVNRATSSEAEDSAGKLVSFAANTPRITDRGLWVEDGAANKSPDATNPAAWRGQGGVTAQPTSGGFKPIAFTAGGGRQPAAAAVATGQSLVVRARYKAPGSAFDAGGAIRFNFHFPDGKYTFLYGYDGGLGTGAALQQGSAATFSKGSDRYLGNGVWEMQGTLQPAATGTADYGIGPDPKYNSNAGALVVYGTQMQAGGAMGSWIAASNGVRANENATYAPAVQAIATAAAKVYAMTDTGAVYEIGAGAIPHSGTPIRKIGFFSRSLSANEKLQWAYGDPMLRGVNLGCGACSNGFFWPNDPDLDFYVAKGVKAVRLPFLMERAQPTLNGALDENYMKGIDKVVAHLEAAGVSTILDMHNFQHRGNDLIGGKTVSVTAFADVWRRIAARYADSSRVILELMNEPAGDDATAAIVLSSQNAATKAIRNVGFKGMIFRSVTGYSGAHQFNSPAMQDAYTRANVTDTGPFAFDLHEYLDQYSAGMGGDCVSGASNRIDNAILWARRNGFKINLGETGAISSAACDVEMPKLLGVLESNRDVVIGWQEWLVGLDPGGNSPQMTKYFAPLFAKAF